MTLDPQMLSDIAVALHEIGAVKLGRFTLHSGRTSPIYLDLRLLISHPAALRLVARAYAALLEGLSFDLLAAIPYAGLPIGVAVSLEMERPLIYPRKEVKSYGTGQRIEGEFNVGQRAIVVEDLVTSGRSILQGVAVLKASGLQIRDAVVLIDREQGGVTNLQQEGYALHRVMTLNHLLSLLEDAGRIDGGTRMRVLGELRGK